MGDSSVTLATRSRSPRVQTASACLVYLLLTIALTWPVARGLAHDVPSDFGDPLLNASIIAWDATRILDALSGDVSSLFRYWDAPIFHPHPLALAYSEHLTAQALQALPVFGATRNPILAYNLLLLSTFFLSALGMFLLARELTGSPVAAFIAGLAFGFAPYRFTTLAHLQVLSSAWMPFAMLGLRRFFETKRLAPLAGGSIAWVLQNLSCGYYLLYFSPVLALYLAWELVARRRWVDRATVVPLIVSVIAVSLITLPFVWPYLELRRLGFAPRSLAETDKFSADVWSYLTAGDMMSVWGGLMRAWPKPEGDLFPGLTAIVLSACAVWHAWRSAQKELPTDRGRTARVLRWLAGGGCVVVLAMLAGWSLRLETRFLSIQIRDLDRAVRLSALLVAAHLLVSPSARTAVARFLRSTTGLWLLIGVLAWLMSLGPHIVTRGETIDQSTLYGFFYSHVPGFDGLRVPARFGMIVSLAMAGLVACAVSTWRDRLTPRAPATAILTMTVLAESLAIPLPINGNSLGYLQSGLTPLPDTLPASSDYAFVDRLPREAVLLELPLGEPAFDVRYMLSATRHRRRLVNGYSGGSPADYELLTFALADAESRPLEAWRSLIATGATHVVVHEDSFQAGRGPKISGWLSTHGAREVDTLGDAHVYAIPR